MIVIGVTGGVGSGKSAILTHVQQSWRARVLLADDAARSLYAPGGRIYEQLVALLESAPVRIGAEREHALLDEQGRIRTQEMAARIFASGELLGQVNALVHPATKRYILEEIERERTLGRQDFFVVEAALLIENGFDAIVDHLWYIHTDPQVRRQRLRASRGYSDEKIDRILASQLSDEEFYAHCDTVIENSAALEEALTQVDEVLSGYLRTEEIQ